MFYCFQPGIDGNDKKTVQNAILDNFYNYTNAQFQPRAMIKDWRTDSSNFCFLWDVTISQFFNFKIAFYSVISIQEKFQRNFNPGDGCKLQQQDNSVPTLEQLKTAKCIRSMMMRCIVGIWNLFIFEVLFFILSAFIFYLKCFCFI